MAQHAWNSSLDLGSIPELPGVYLFRDEAGAVLYVGKSARLRDRVRTYRSGGDGRWQIRRSRITRLNVMTDANA